ncbi:MAG: kynureninase [Hyphomicrobiales bacterium]
MTDFAKTKQLFHLPAGMIYLDGNSLGPMPKAASEHVRKMLEEEWATELIKGWNSAGWYTQPNMVGDRVAKLLGAPKGSIVMGDTLSLKVHQALSSALAMNPDRKVILSDSGNFPTDLYIASGIVNQIDNGHVIKTPAPEDAEEHIDDSVAVLMLTEVDYRTGRKHDMKKLTEKAHAHGVITIWDLAHSAGAIDVDLTAANADFAVGCTYKYLNGGPGAPAFIYVAPRHIENAAVGLSGWMGHEQPFAFDLDYTPAKGIARMRVGTPPVIALSALEASLDIWESVDMAAVWARSRGLSELFIEQVEAKCPQLKLFSPRNPNARGSQISFCFEDGYAVMQALIADNVIGDFRQPDVLRFGFTPLYIDEDDIVEAVARLHNILDKRLWDTPEFKAMKAVT